MLHMQIGRHVGIEGNELADRLARGAVNKKVMRSNQFTTYSFLTQRVKELIIEAWTHDWTSELFHEEEGRKSKGLGKFYRIQAQTSIPTFSTKPMNFQGHNRSTESAYFQAKTGIGNIRAYLFKIGKTKDETCNFCKNGKQTMQHLILHCQNYSKERKESFINIEPLILPIFEFEFDFN
ncbi:hypothetical protein BGHDH14_bgh03315 [Blumeria hordei DH14]|uniref:Uncharacterized protein n=1 Tax=Blumeria graminis f. sp. hordei (strain DH14) TaxID=546991 RepID=N1JRG0_BLUG1|nr:hypothetical protein BGHDH14_bgh03315 [Blumeria hordei DH14]